MPSPETSRAPDASPARRPAAVQPCFASAHNSHAAVAANETMRRLKHGRVRPMRQPSLSRRLIERLLGW